MRVSYAFKAVVATFTVGIAICASADPTANVDIEAALARINAIRLGADPDSQLLERALTVLGDSYLNANQYAKAEPAQAGDGAARPLSGQEQPWRSDQ